jgi:PEP-CTERM motif
MKTRITSRLALAARPALLACALGAAGLAQAAVMPLQVWSLGADFENGLGAWFDRNPTSPDALIVSDPLRPGNHVLAFDRLMGSGSVFTNQAVSTTGSYTLSFDYLGLPGLGGVAGNLGGYIGVSVGGHASTQYWVGGTGSYQTPLALIDDGQWHSYSYTFSVGWGQPVRVMVEDWDGSGGVARDAFFDNISLRDSSIAAPSFAQGASVPEPGSLALVALALAGVAALRTRGRRD